MSGKIDGRSRTVGGGRWRGRVVAWPGGGTVGGLEAGHRIAAALSGSALQALAAAKSTPGGAGAGVPGKREKQWEEAP